MYFKQYLLMDHHFNLNTFLTILTAKLFNNACDFSVWFKRFQYSLREICRNITNFLTLIWIL